jgi:hypothetical protein
MSLSTKGSAATINIESLHFPRSELAARMMFIFEHQLEHALTLFAPEQKGKTTFLQQDFIPLASQHGFLVAVADLQTEPNNPERAIAMALQDSVHRTQSQRQNMTLLPGLNRIVSMARAFSNARNGRTSMKSEGGYCLKRWLEQFRAAGKGRALLIVEAAELLAARSAFKNFTAKLRSLLQAPSSRVYIVFVGASPEGQANLFRRKDAPFYEFGFALDFPNLGKEFVCQLGVRFKEVTGVEWDVDLAHDLFRRYGEMPGLLIALYVASVSHGLGVKEAAEVVLATPPPS